MTADQDILAAIDAATGCQYCTGPLGDSPSGDFCSPSHQRQWHEQFVKPLPWAEDAAVVYVGADDQRVPLTEPRTEPPAWPPRRQLQYTLFVGCVADGCTELVALRGVTGELSSRCPSCRLQWHRENWRLPRQTRNLMADIRACNLARDTATTDAQRAAVALRVTQLAERLQDPWRHLREVFGRLGAAVARAAEQLTDHVRTAYGVTAPPEQTGDDRADAMALALHAQRHRNTGPAAPRMDGRRGREVRR